MLKPRGKITVTILLGVAISMMFSVAATAQGQKGSSTANYCYDTTTDVNCYPTLLECQEAQADREFFDPDVIITNDCRFVGGQAKPTTISTSDPFSGAGEPLCQPGETVDFSGVLHTVIHVTDGPGDSFTYSIFHTNFQGVSGVTSSGDRVSVSDTSTSVSNVRQISANELVAEVHGVMAVQGKQTNTVFTATLHIVMNANGQVTSDVENVKTHCVGQG